MHSTNETRITDSHFDLLAEHGIQIAVVAVVNLDCNAVVSVDSFHRYEDTYVLQTGSPRPQVGRLDTYESLLDYYGDDPDIVRKTIETHIKNQKHSDNETRFTWDLITGTDAVETDDRLADTLDTVVGPDRLDPDFEIPDDEPVATLDIGSQAHEIIKEATEYRAGVPVKLHRHRGTTYLVGLTDEYARAISESIHTLQMEYSNNGSYDAAETAERVEGEVLHAET